MILQRKTTLIKKASVKKSTRDRTLIKLPKSPRLMISASGISNKTFLSSNPDELCERLTLLRQEKQAGVNFDIINDGNVAKVDNIL